MEFKIPIRYRVGGQEIYVEHVPSDGEDYGNYTHCLGRIRICDKAGDTPQGETQKVNTFIHELVHSILRTMGEIELNANEKFVNTFASFLTEAIRSMED